MQLKVKVSITNEEDDSFMGIGLVWLLERIKKYGSINQAAKDMKMSYVKAHKIIEKLEKNLGRKLLIKTIGGKNHGGAQLTPFAEKYISKYNSLQKRIKSYAEKEYDKFIMRVEDIT